MGNLLKHKEKNFFCLIHALLLVCIVLLGAGKYAGIGKPGVPHLLCALLVMVLLSGILLLPVKGRLLSLLFISAFLCIAVFAAGIQQSLLFLRTYFSFLAGSNGQITEWVPGYELLQVILISLLCFSLQILFEKYYPVKAVFSTLLLLGLLFCLFAKKTLSHTGVVFSLFYVVLTCAEGIQLKWKKIKNRDTKAHMIWIMPFLAVYFVLMLLMPAPKKPYDWQFVKNAVYRIKETFVSLTQNLFQSGNDDFDTSLSGFSEDGNLSGDITENNRELMVIQGSDSLQTNVYLTGKVFDTFDGRQWTQEYHDTSRDYLSDTAETRSAVQAYHKELARDYLYKTSLLIRYRYFYTSYLFAPLKIDNIEEDGKNLSPGCDGGSLLFDDKAGYGTEYEVTYYQLNVDSEEFYHFLESASNLPALETGNDGRQYVQKIYDTYLEDVPLSIEVKNYLEAITKDAESDLDKLRLIERALSSFSYNLAPGPLPKSVTDAGEFLDYFLLESRQGYCSYFASAFVLLARAEGFPARYVQGFCVPVTGKGETSVYSYMAHAWPEVYIDNVGWIPFEPTPGYAAIRYTPWKTSQSSSYLPLDTRIPQQENNPAPAETLPDANPLEEEPQNNRPVLKIAAYAFLTVLALCLILLIPEHILGRRRYRKMTLSDKFCAEVGYNLKVLAWLGLRRNATETLQEFQERSSRLLEKNQEDNVLLFLGRYESLLYGTGEITEETIRETGRERKLLLAALKEKSALRFYLFTMVSLFFPFTYS
mgnify:CR=1 FL=1